MRAYLGPGKAARTDWPHVVDYLDPVCRPSTLDSYGNVALLLKAVKRALPNFHGDVLDVGCGLMPYKSLLLVAPSRARKVTGLDLPSPGYNPDIVWDGQAIPLGDASVDCAMLTEVLEHCPQPGHVLTEVCRVLKPGGFLFLTVPVIWTMHDIPFDEFRYTPFALRRLLGEAGFPEPRIEATGGRNAALAVFLGLWALRRPVETRGQGLVVADKDDGAAGGPAFGHEQLEKAGPGVGVERGGGLVRDQQLRFANQRPRGRHPLLLANAELRHPSVQQPGVIEAQPAEQAISFDPQLQAPGPRPWPAPGAVRRTGRAGPRCPALTGRAAG